jgi:hypothetical protein
MEQKQHAGTTGDSKATAVTAAAPASAAKAGGTATAAKKTRIEKRKDHEGKSRDVDLTIEGGAFFVDTGEAYDEESIRIITSLAMTAAPTAEDFATQHRVNAEIYFYKLEVVDEKTDVALMNRVRGFPLSFFKRPAFMGNKNDTGESRESGVCWLYTTTECWVTNRNKVVQKVPAGTVIWVDLNQALNPIFTRGRPVTKTAKDAEGKEIVETVEIFEIGINPKRKRTIPAAESGGTPRQAWQVDVFGGAGPLARRDGYRSLSGRPLEALKSYLQIPELRGLDLSKFESIDAEVEVDVIDSAHTLPESTAT